MENKEEKTFLVTTYEDLYYAIQNGLFEKANITKQEFFDIMNILKYNSVAGKMKSPYYKSYNANRHQ